MPTFEFGDTVLVPFPFTDVSVSKKRPAVVLSTRAFGDTSQQAILAMITTGSRSSWQSDININDLNTAGIPHASVIRFKVFTMPNDMIISQLGRLGQADHAALRSGIAQTIG